MAQLFLVSLLEVEAAVVQGLVVVLLEDLGEERLHLQLHPAPLLVLLVQACQHHLDGDPGILLQQLHYLGACVTCTPQGKDAGYQSGIWSDRWQ